MAFMDVSLDDHRRGCGRSCPGRGHLACFRATAMPTRMGIHNPHSSSRLRLFRWSKAMDDLSHARWSIAGGTNDRPGLHDATGRTSVSVPVLVTVGQAPGPGAADGRRPAAV